MNVPFAGLAMLAIGLALFAFIELILGVFDRRHRK